MPNGDHNYQYGKFEGEVIERLDSIDAKLEEIKQQKVDRAEFSPVKSIVYGLVGIILMAVASALVAGVVRASTVLLSN